MKWIKVSERFPDNPEDVIMRVISNRRQVLEEITELHDEYLIYKEEYIYYDDIEWLDETIERVFYIDEVRKMLIRYKNEEISLSKFVELLNEKATGLDSFEMYKLFNKTPTE